MQVPSGFESVQCVVDSSFSQRLGGGAVVGVEDPVGGLQFGGVGAVVFAEDPEHATRRDGTVLGGVPDKPHRGAGGGHGHE